MHTPFTVHRSQREYFSVNPERIWPKYFSNQNRLNYPLRLLFQIVEESSNPRGKSIFKNTQRNDCVFVEGKLKRKHSASKKKTENKRGKNRHNKSKQFFKLSNYCCFSVERHFFSPHANVCLWKCAGKRFMYGKKGPRKRKRDIKSAMYTREQNKNNTKLDIKWGCCRQRGEKVTTFLSISVQASTRYVRARSHRVCVCV